jgi:hypothetical protein
VSFQIAGIDFEAAYSRIELGYLAGAVDLMSAY